MSKSLVNIKSAWAIQEDAFKSNLPLMDDKIKKVHTFDRRSMGTVFPFTTSEVGHPSGIPLGINKQTGVPILFDNFHSSLTNYNMVIFAKYGAGKSVTMKTLISRSAVLMGIAGLHDLWNFEHLPDKSGFWFIANIFILMTYFIMIKTSCKFYDNTQQRITDFLHKLERDNKKYK